MFCTSCGANLGTRSLKFCLQCGAPLKPRADVPAAAAEAGPSAGASRKMGAPVEPGLSSAPLTWDTADFLDVLRIPGTGTGEGDTWEDRYASVSAPPPAPRDTGIGSVAAVCIVCAVLAAAAGGAWWFFSQPETSNSGSRETSTATAATPPHDPATENGNDALALSTETDGGQAETTQPPRTGATTEPSSVAMIENLPEIQRAGGHNNPNIQPIAGTAPHSGSSSTSPKQTESATSLPPLRSASRQTGFPPGQSVAPSIQSGQLEISGQSGAIAQPEISEPPAHTESRREPPTRIATTQRRLPEPPWLDQMREDLKNCADFWCRENVRRARCKGRWKNLPECKSAAL
ncbi:MAG: hypothetical protein LBE06_03695 [Azoarcus sp.]|jgi:hypothetical protein|nr:hypothetical protein [Azoarcus sp.]